MICVRRADSSSLACCACAAKMHANTDDWAMRQRTTEHEKEYHSTSIEWMSTSLMRNEIGTEGAIVCFDNAEEDVKGDRCSLRKFESEGKN